MLFSEKLSAGRRQFIHAVFIPVVISILIILVFLLEKGMNWDFHKAGIMPRDFKYLTGIFTYIFIHADWGHLTNNLLSFLVLGSCLFYFYNLIATKVLFFSYILSGILLWLIGRENWHIGASGLIYSIAFFLFFSGLIRKHIPLIAISLIITFLYGSMIWHVFPWKVNDPISWEGHLSGGISGLVLSVIYRKSGPQRPEIDWGEEDDDFEESDSEFIENEESTEEKLKVD
ncbi:MAG: rhomboid family intramembrane serine protease [Paludibacter sp.]